ncbi:uncharacterized protein GGS25DRAFT_516786 [Hypoxylon fragiforme]|uniref:uncharacterized protein n=1 Tax=Hypoxylon fragiforme TaxID=63214 RepID=UPI0020C70D07|nr:uncharacterized protein GGS25DRAFT_516786 [Hypoxylon fragiforme]KAI2613928.1 hypothetical protein GGS25DRAFT_516786 [Hypoxylon fragiforme]
MADFFGAVLRLIFKGKPQEGRTDEEQGGNNAESTAGFAPPMNATVNGHPSALPHGHRSYLVPEDDALTLFRLMVGISTSPYLGYSESSPIGTRPAANIGIYARVVYSEQKAKDRYKVFSIVINACYFFQIVVAASITAMGAAGVSHGAVTAFGAINTIIAGILTFLKGSGLPSRLKYYGNEWKKIREYIEQRERDFSRAGCTLDVYEVVATVDRMYNTTKREIEMNTPDSYTSVTGNMRSFMNGSHEKIAAVHAATLEEQLKGLESKALDVRNRIHEHGKGIGEDVRDFEKTVVKEAEERKAAIEREARERKAELARTVEEGHREVMNQTDQVIRDVGETHRTAVGDMRAAASAQVRRVADSLSHHHEPHEKLDK